MFFIITPQHNKTGQNNGNLDSRRIEIQTRSQVRGIVPGGLSFRVRNKREPLK
jgi:hypothetical protein